MTEPEYVEPNTSTPGYIRDYEEALQHLLQSFWVPAHLLDPPPPEPDRRAIWEALEEANRDYGGEA